MPSHIFHVGCMKTGTTTIQNTLAADERLNLILHSRYFNTNKYYENSPPDYNKANVNIESDEGLVRCYEGLYGVEESIRRICDSFPDAKILVTIREQRALLLSGYKHHIRQTTDNFTFYEFLNSSAGISYLKFLNYASLYESINQYFDSDHVFFLPFEILKKNYESFFLELYNEVLELEPPEFEKRKLNTGDSDNAVLFKRKLNRFLLFKNQKTLSRFEELIHKKFYKVCRKINPSTKDIIKWPSGKLYDQLENHFRNTNNEFQDLTGINLNQFDYLL